MSDFNMGQFPTTRLRRLRMKEFSRRMISENNLSVNDLIWPLFVCEGSNVAEKINSMPGVFRYSIDNTKVTKLGWKPMYTISQGMKKTVNWYVESF